ncbi:MAG: hypothetical protein ACLVJH_07275 [Faecalibacterium prausnitzii]
MQKLATSGTPAQGVCGGYQMLGETLADPEGTERADAARPARGWAPLPIQTGAWRTQSINAHGYRHSSPRRSWRGSA